MRHTGPGSLARGIGSGIFGQVRAEPLVTRPRVSVAIPCYNYENYLPDAVGSALDQPGVDVDVIIVDNASTDGSAAVAAAMSERDSRVRLIRHATNQGHIASFNEGVHSATGDYVVMLCADDMLAPGSLSRSVALLEAYPNVAFAYGYAQVFAGTPLPDVPADVRGWVIQPGQSWMERRCRSGRNVIFSPEVVMRTSVMNQLDYDARIPHTADLILWLRAALVGDVGRVMGPCQGFFREHGGNLHLGEGARILSDLHKRRDTFDLFCTERQPRLYGAARRALAREGLVLARRAYDKGGSFAGATAEEYAQFAVESSPEVRRSWTWRSYEGRIHSQTPRWRRRGSEAISDARDSVRWRLWRRYGV